MKLRPLEEVLLHPEHRAEVARLRAGYAGGWRACLDAVFKETQYTVCDACEGVNHEDGIVCGYCAIGSRNPTAPPAAPASPEPRPAASRLTEAWRLLYSVANHSLFKQWPREAQRAVAAWLAESPEPEGERGPNMDPCACGHSRIAHGPGDRQCGGFLFEGGAKRWCQCQRFSELPRADIGPKESAARANAASEGKSLAAGDGAHEPAAADGPTSTHRTPAPASPPSPAPGEPCAHGVVPPAFCHGCWDRMTLAEQEAFAAQRRAPSPAPEAAPCQVKSGHETRRGTCFGCGAIVEPTLCLCGAMHVGTYCWPCHHKNVGPDRCAAPFCPEHGFPATERWLKERAPAPSPAADARKGDKP